MNLNKPGIDFENLPEEQADSIPWRVFRRRCHFRSRGGSEPTDVEKRRNAHYLITGRELEHIEFESVGN